MGSLRAIPTIGRLTASSPPGSVPKAPPPTKHQGRPLPNLSLPEVTPRGPALLHLAAKRIVGAGGPGEKPMNFLGPQTEWVWHWASRKYFFNVEHLDPFTTPWGGLSWEYQVSSTPADIRSPGSEVTDFIYHVGARDVLVRIEGFFDHVQRGGAAQTARDAYLIAHAGVAGDQVVRISDDQFMGDVTGSRAIQLLADTLAGRTSISKLAGGTIEAPRYAGFVAGTQ